MLEVSDGVYLQGKELDDYCLRKGRCRTCGKVKVRRKVVKVFGSNSWEPITTVKVGYHKHKDNFKGKKKASKYTSVKAKIESGNDDNVEYLVYKGHCLSEGCYTLEQAKGLAGIANKGIGSGNGSPSLGSSKSTSSNQNSNSTNNSKRGKLFSKFQKRLSNPFFTPTKTDNRPLVTVGEDSDVQKEPSVLSPLSRMTNEASTDFTGDTSNSFTKQSHNPLHDDQIATPRVKNTTKSSVLPSPQVRKTYAKLSSGSRGSPKKRNQRRDLDTDEAKVARPVRKVISETISALQSISSHPEKRTRNMSGLKLQPSEMEALAKMFRAGKNGTVHLESLVLNNCGIDDSLTEVLAEALYAALFTANHRIVKNNPTSNSASSSSNAKLNKSMRHARMRLQSLDLGDNVIGDKGIFSLCLYFESISCELEHLDLSKNSIETGGGAAFFDALKRNPQTKIESIDLSCNLLRRLDHDDDRGQQQQQQQYSYSSIGIPGRSYGIHGFLSKNKTLMELDLSSNGMNDEWVEALCRGLSLNSKSALKHLNLGYNHIGNRGAVAIGMCLTVNRSLVLLELNDNHIENDGARALLEAIEDNSTINNITGLWSNRIETPRIIVRMRQVLVSEARKKKHRPISNTAGVQKSNECSDDDSEDIYITPDGESTIPPPLHTDSDSTSQRNNRISDKKLFEDNEPQEEEENKNLSDLLNTEDDGEVSDLSNSTSQRNIGISDKKLLEDNEGTKPQEEENKNLSDLLNTEDDGEFNEGTKPQEEEEENKNLSDLSNTENDGEVSDLSDQDDEEDSESYQRLLQDNFDAIAMEASDGLMETNQEVTHNMFDRMTIINSSPLVCFDDKEINTHRAISLLDTLHETEAIKAVIEAHHPTKGSRIEVKEEMATLDNFKSFFSARDSAVLHISCHGFDDGIALEDGYGSLEKLSLSGLNELFSGGVVRNTLELVFVTSPSALQIGKAFLEAGVKRVVCCERKNAFRDPLVVRFMESFYEHASQKETLTESFETALRTVVSSPLSKNSSMVSNRFHLLPLYLPQTLSSPVFFQRFVPNNRGERDDDQSNQEQLEMHQRNYILPPLPDYFLGREIEIFKILEALQVADCVEVSGSPGCGKKSIIGASLEYALKRYETFEIDQICWIPALKRAMVDPDSLYGELRLCCDLIRDSNEDLWDRSEEVLDCRERLAIELEGAKVVVVIDTRSFSSVAALDKLITFIVTYASSAKVICVSSTTSAEANGTEDSGFAAFTTSTIQIGALPFRSTARLFGEISKHVSRSNGSLIARSGTEFSELADLPFVSRMRNSSSDVSRTSERRTEILGRIGNGFPAQVIDSGKNMSLEKFDELMNVILTPEISIDSLSELQSELQRRNEFMALAIKDRNYKRSADIETKINELEIMKLKFSSLKDLKAKEKSMKSELADAVSNRRYDVANELKRDLLVLKKKIMKERRVSTSRSGDNPNGVLSDFKFQVDSLANTLEHDDYGVFNEETNLFDVDCDGHTCTFHIYSGSVFDPKEQLKSKGIGIVCWSNEACDLEGSLDGKALLDIDYEFKERVTDLPIVEETRHGSVRCLMGKSVILDARSDSESEEDSVAILTVGPFASPSGQIDAMLERDEEFRRFSLATLRSCYRACVQQTERAELQSLSVCPLTTRTGNGQFYEETLRVTVREIVEEAKFSTGLREVRLVGKTPKEAALLVGIMKTMGFISIS
jgi:hypothetical protein